MNTDGYTVSNYLFDRLEDMGIDHVFGVPGDYAFPLLGQLAENSELEWVGGCNEHNAALTADGYARSRGFAAVVTTCGPGELGIVGALGGSYAEQVPVIAIVGHPPLREPASGRMTHHSLNGDFSGYAEIFAQLTVGHAELGAENPCGQIDEVLSAVAEGRRPGWIAIPKDVQSMPAQPPTGKLSLRPAGDPAELDAFMAELLPRIEAATAPAILLDYPVGRYQLTPVVHELMARSGIPLAMVFSGRSAFFDEDTPGYLGVYYAPRPGDPVGDRIAGADLLLRLGITASETNTGCAAHAWHADHVVDLQPLGAVLGDTRYPHVAMADVLERLTAALTHRDVPGLPSGPGAVEELTSFTPRPDTAMTENRVLDGVAALLREHDRLVSDQGTCFSVTTLRKPAAVTTIAQGDWGAIGFGTPALLGSMLAEPRRRHVMVTGDGGFQEVAQEWSTILRHGLAPIVVLLNNGHYVVENSIGYAQVKDLPYNVINTWDYHRLPGVLHPGGDAVGIRVSTEQEWSDALAAAEKAQTDGRFVLIEVMLDKDDVNDSYLRMMSPSIGN